ncbi:coiled-coil domain-containing protein 187 [Engystomops pustulosus]
MSSREDGDGSGLGPRSHVQDVSLAWDSLLEAKHVLQRIENKVDIQNQRRKQAQKVRRRLQLDRESLSGPDSCSSVIKDSSPLGSQQSNRMRPDETFTLLSVSSFPSKMDIPWDLSHNTRPTTVLLGEEPSVVNFHHNHMDFTRKNILAKSSQENILNGQVMALAGSSVDQVQKTSHVGLQTYAPEGEMGDLVNPYLEETSPWHGEHIGPRSSPITPSPPPKDDLYVQKLEHLKRRSPRSKLDKLKEKIQEQKKRQELSKKNLPKPRPNSDPLHKPTMKRKVCKVTFTPAAPHHKVFGATDKDPIPPNCKEDDIKREKENLKQKSHKIEEDTVSSKEKTKTLKSRSPVTRKLSFKSPSPERKTKNCGLYGASAWREGQKLVQQILGPSPVVLHRSPKADDQHSMQKGSCRRCQKIASPNSLKPQKNTKVKVKGRQDRTPVISHISAEEQGSNPASKDEDKAGKCKRPKSFSPKPVQPVTCNNPEKRSLGKENVGSDHEGQSKDSKRRSSYSAEQIRDFMKKKAMERQKTERENQTMMKKVVQMRKEKIDHVLKKQKEAFPPRKGVTSTVSWKTPHIQPCEAENVRNKLSEWIHATSEDLLREDEGGSRNSKKQKTENLSKKEQSSPLRLQDLAPAKVEDIQVKDVNSSKWLNDDPLPSHKTSDVFLQCRGHQEHLHTLWATAKDLGRRVELECTRLGSPSLGQHSEMSVSSPSPASQVTQVSGKYPIVAEKNLQVNTRTSPEEPREKTTQTKKLHPKDHSEKRKKSSFIHRSASTSPHRESDVRSPKLQRETSLSPPRRKTGSPRRTTSPAYSDKKGKRGISHYKETSPMVTRMDIASKIKAKLQQQEKDLSTLRLKAEAEAEEAQRCLEEMLRLNKRKSPGLRTSSPEKLQPHGQDIGNDRFRAGSQARMEVVKRCTGSPVTAHGTVNAAPTDTESPEHSWDHTEPATDSTSKWSEVGQFYGSPNMFTRFSLEMSQQYLREEELRARHQTALLRLREEALKEKTKAELALLNQQKIYWETKNEPSKVEEFLKQEREIQRNLKQEQAEILHLHNIYKAAHQERKLLLRQQKEILRIQQAAVHIQQKLHNSGVRLQDLGDLNPSTQQSRCDTLHDSTFPSEHLNQDTQSAISDLSEDEDIKGKTQSKETYLAQRSESKSISPAPEVCDSTRSGLQNRDKKEEAAYIPDGTAEDNLLLDDGRRSTGSPPNHLTIPKHSQEDQSNHSTARQWGEAHEENVSRNKNEISEETFVNRQETEKEAAGQSRDNLDWNDEDKKITEKQDPKKILGTKEAASNEHSVSEPVNNHSSRTIQAPSSSESPSRASDIVALSPSLGEFRKVSAKLINISESSVSASDRLQGGEDTESGDSEVFDMESSEVPPGRAFNKEWGENLINQDDDIITDGDKQTTSPTKFPESRKAVILVMKETQSKTETAPLACESFPTSEDLTESDTKTHGVNHSPENQDGSIVRVTDTHKATSMSPKDDGNAAGMSSPDTKERQRMTETNEKQSVTESAICRKIEMMPFHAPTSKDLFQIKSFPHRSEGDIIFITDEVLQPIEDTLSEILSPVDEKLSYESAELYSQQQDQSEELPSLPRDPDSIYSADSDSEDFPTPPEGILLSRSGSLQSSSEASLIDEIHLLYDSLLTEETLLPPDQIVNMERSPLEIENSRPEVMKPCRPFLTLSKAEDTIQDPLSTFEIGDRVLVKLSKPGTLMYKGLTSFQAGYWAGVALDKPEGDNDGTYEGVRYFECSKKCGVFVRPGQISHLLFDDVDGSDPQKDEDDDYSFGGSPSPGDGQPQDEGTSRRQHEEKEVGKFSSEKDTKQNQFRSSENGNDPQDADISPRSLHTPPEGPIVQDKSPDPASQTKQCCRGDTNKLIVPIPPQDDKHRLLVKVTDEAISGVLCDATGTYSKISAPETESVMNGGEEEDEKCVRAEEGSCNHLSAVTTREAGGYVDTLVVDVIDDCIKEYKKIKSEKGKKCILQSNGNYSPPVLVSGEDRLSALMSFTDGIFEELVKDSLQVIADISSNRAQGCPSPAGGTLPSR